MSTIDDLKAQRRWVLWRLETRDEKETKVPYQANGYHADSTDQRTWQTYAEVAAVAHLWSGVGIVLGEVDGIHVSGVDIDNCCDAMTGKFTPESREIVIALDSYAEYSPSGTGCHILVIGNLRGRKGIKLPFPGAKAVELYDQARYLTFTGRHLTKTPNEVIEREDAFNELYDRVRATKHSTGLTVSVSISEQERLERLMAGDMSLHNEDQSVADFALCCLLAKKHDCNAFKIDAEFRESKLYRDDKWEREDYRENTIARAIKAVAKELPIVFDHEAMDDDSPTEYIVAAKPGELEGWFPKGELSLIGAASGRGKSSWAMPLLEDVRQCKPVWGHPAGAGRDYRILLHDRSIKATRRTIAAQHLGQESKERLVRLTREQQKRDPGETLAAYMEAIPGVETWFIEGLDFWFSDPNSARDVADVLDNLGRVAVQYDIAIVATVGSPKMKGKERYYGRDSLFGSSALGRKVETVVLMNLTDPEDNNSVRRCDVLKRNGPSETFYFTFTAADGLVQTEKPEDKPSASSSAINAMSVAVEMKFGFDKPISFLPGLGARSTYKRWKEWAQDNERIHKYHNRWYLVRQSGGCHLTSEAA